MGDKIMSVKDKQKASLDVLINLDDFCEKHGIRYYLAYGTLLGAIRHKGFIPWDDDVDVFVPRPDYEILLQKYHDESGLSGIVSCDIDKGYFLPFAKIENLKTVRIENRKKDTHGIGIDIFPLDGLPEDLQKAEAEFYESNKKFLNILTRFQTYRSRGPTSLINTGTYILERILERTGYLKRLSMQISKNIYGTSFDDSEMVACVTGIHSGKFRAFRKDWFESEWASFEGHKLRIPKGYDSILKMVYGNYMNLPPEDKRITTHSDTFIWIDK